MLTVKQAENLILDLIQPITDIELVNLSQATNRILAQPITSPLDFPYWDNSAMDGYAVRFADVMTASEDNPVTLEIIEEIPAGYCPQKVVNSQQASRIFTGAMLPEGADTIVIQENTEREGNFVKILFSPQENEFIRQKGSFYRANDCLLSAGIKINPPEIAILATAQCNLIPVVRSPKIAIISNGNELITPEQTLQKGQIIDSNQYLLASFITQNGGIPICMGIVPDDPDLLKQTITKALEEADLIISTGGVSVGEYDYVEKVLQELGGKIQVSSVAIKPGKPLTVSKFPHSKIYFGIPGNPVSTMVICWRFLQSAIAKLSGWQNHPYPQLVQGITINNLRTQGQRETYLWGTVKLVEGRYEFSLNKGAHNSGNLINLQQTNALAKIPVGEQLIEIGEEVEILLVN